MNDLTGVYVREGGEINPNLDFLLNEWTKWRVLMLQGGTRSGKTYSAVDFLIYIINEFQGLTISIVRATLPSLKASVLRDFRSEMEDLGYWSNVNFNKSELTYAHNNNLIEFFSIDNEEKVRGRKRQILYANEIQEIDSEKLMQLFLRTEGFIIGDFNPSMVTSYIYDDILTREDCALLVTNYRHNPHLPIEVIKEIEHLKTIDPEAWKVYGEGQRANNRLGVVLDYWRETRDIPSDLRTWYGVDFGFTNDPTAIVRICFDEKNMRIYLKEIAYQKGLQNADIARIIKQDIWEKRTSIWNDTHEIYVQNGRLIGKGEVTLVEVRDGSDNYREWIKDNPGDYYKELEKILKFYYEVYCDIAEQKSISELRSYGLSAYGCIKGKGSVESQLSFMRYFEIFYIGDNIKTEVENYKWRKKKDEKDFDNTPLDAFNHAADASRYGIYTHLTREGFKFDKILGIK